MHLGQFKQEIDQLEQTVSTAYTGEEENLGEQLGEALYIKVQY